MLRRLHFLCFAAAFQTLSCGSGGSINLTDVVGIQAGDKEGSSLTGTFAVSYEVTSGGCDSVSALGTSPDGTKSALDVEVTQTAGVISFNAIEDTLQGGIQFENDFETGAAKIIDKAGETGNILRLVRFTGLFSDADNFSGTGEERLQGRIAGESVDCTFSFKVSGIRK